MPYYSWADQVLSFSNYDIQILDVCPDTNSVVALLCVLLQTAKTPKPVSDGLKTADCTLRIVDCRMWIADCVDGRW